MSDKILVVDDDIDSLKLIGLMLQRQGYEVVAANAGNQALAKAHSEQPDLIILDVMMPDMNGYEVCRRLRNSPATQEIPIIMFSAKTLIDDKVAGFEAGADDYLTKPTHPAELAARIQQILSRAPKAPPQPEATTRGKAIGIIGTKGGIGTSTVALNLAAAMRSQPDAAPLLVDFHLGSGSLGLMLGFEPVSGVANLLARPAEDLRPHIIEQALLTHACGLRALLSTYDPRETQRDVPTENALALIEGLRALSHPLIIDFGSEYNLRNSRLLAEMEQIIVVVEPQNIALKMANALLGEIETTLRKKADVVVVSRNPSKLQIPWHEVEARLDREILAIVSAAAEPLYQATEAGVPIVVHQPNTIVASQLIKLAADLKV